MSCFRNKLEPVVAGHYALEHCVAFLADVGDTRTGVVTDKGRRRRERIYLKRHALDLEFVGNYRRHEFLLELRNIYKFDADAGMFKPIQSFAVQRQIIFVRQLDLHAKFVADQDVVFPACKTAADADLFKLYGKGLAEFGIDDRRNVERKSDVLALVDRHFWLRPAVRHKHVQPIF